MPETNYFIIFTRPLERLGFPYMVTGSVASMIYGEPRLTHDVDIVVDLPRHGVAAFVQAFPLEEFYCPPEEVIRVELSRRAKGHMNIIHHASGFKADIFPAGKDPLHHWALPLRRKVTIHEESLSIAPPEYVILRKLQYFKEGGSEKHLRDVQCMLESDEQLTKSGLLGQKIAELGLQAEWDELLQIDG